MTQSIQIQTNGNLTVTLSTGAQYQLREPMPKT